MEEIEALCLIRFDDYGAVRTACFCLICSVRDDTESETKVDSPIK